MHLNKENPIIVTKSQYTAEEFIQKKIELLVEMIIVKCFAIDCFVFLFLRRKIKLNHSMPLTSKISVTNISDGLL